MEVYERRWPMPRPEGRPGPTRRREWGSRGPSPVAAAGRSGFPRSSKSPRAGRSRPRRGPGGRKARVGRHGVVAGAGLTALALQRIGIESIGRALVAATPWWVLAAFALMCASMLLRAEAWHAILRAALPGRRPRRRDTARATMIGVLMSATLPARLGEPSRALIVSRRLGRMRDRFPVVLGTLVSQTLLNILALISWAR